MRKSNPRDGITCVQYVPYRTSYRIFILVFSLQESIELEDSEEEETVTMTNIEKWSDCSSEYRDFDSLKIEEAGNVTKIETWL